MAAKSFWDYIKAAFSAKPKGFVVPPNWIGLAAFGLLGVINPGLWIIGAGVEAAYLLACANSKRFRKVISAGADAEASIQQQATIQQILQSLPTDMQRRYFNLATECQSILRAVRQDRTNETYGEQRQGLSHLVWIYLNLLKARGVLGVHLSNLLAEQSEDGSLESRMEALDEELRASGVTEDLKRSLEGRRNILEERLAKRIESEQKLAFTDAELQRIEEQVQLMRDQAALQSDPGQLSGSIDRISTDLKEASTWITEQRRIYRDLGGTLEEPAPAAIFAEE